MGKRTKETGTGEVGKEKPVRGQDGTVIQGTKEKRGQEGRREGRRREE